MSTDATKAELPASVKRYAIYLMVMAGLGGLLYGIDVGVIAAAVPYIEKTSTYTPSQISVVVAAVLFGSVLSSLFAGMLAEWLGRKKVIILSALLFTLSIPVICFSNGVFGMLMGGRILQGASAGLVGVVVPMYLAECLDANSRGKGTGMFQFLLTVGLVFAAVIGIVVTKWVGPADDVTITSASKVMAWQTIFWCSAIPGLILFFGAFRLKESPRWLYKRGREDEALTALASNNGADAAKEILDEMKAADAAEAAEKAAMKEAAKGDSLLQRKYVIPFILAVIVLACTQATGINSVLNYSVKIFQQSGLEGESANWADLAIKVVNMLMTVVAVSLVDKKGRTFLLKMGTLGIIAGLVGVGAMFLAIESSREDVTELVGKQVKENAYLRVSVEDVYNEYKAANPKTHLELKDGLQLIVTYKQGGSSNQAVAEYFNRGAEVDKISKAGLKDKNAKPVAKAADKPAEPAAEGADKPAEPVATTEGDGQPAAEGADKPAEPVAAAEGAKPAEPVADAKPAVADGFITYEDKSLTAPIDLAAKKQAFLDELAGKKDDSKKLSDRIRLGEVEVTKGDKDEVVKSLQKLESDSDRVIVKPGFAPEPDFVDSMMFWKSCPEVGTQQELVVDRAELGMKPGATTGWMVTLFFIVFISFYAAGPGVCVWLALSELMPTRIRANGMAIALLINQTVSTTIAGTFLPWVGAFGYSSVFFILAGFTVIYFITAAFFMPETKGRTLEEIEQYFATGKMPEKKEEEEGKKEEPAKA